MKSQSATQYKRMNIKLEPIQQTDLKLLLEWVPSYKQMVQWSGPWNFVFPLDEDQFARYFLADTTPDGLRRMQFKYSNDFAAFRNSLKAEPIEWADGVLRFATITHEGPLAAGKVNGTTVDLRPSRVNDSAFIRSDWDSGVICVRNG